MSGIAVGYHDASNVSNVGGDPVTQLHLENVLKIKFVILYSKICAVLDIMTKSPKHLVFLQYHQDIPA